MNKITFCIPSKSNLRYLKTCIPSIREKASLSALFRGKTNEEIEDITLKRVLDMVVEVSAATKEGDIIRDMDHLTIFPFDKEPFGIIISLFDKPVNFVVKISISLTTPI